VQTYSPATEVVLGGFTTISLRFLAGCNGYVSSFYDGDGNYYDAAYLADNCSSSDMMNKKMRIDSVLQQAKYDIIDLHLYDDVEQWDEYYLNFSDTITKPIIVSEFGGPNMNYEPYSDSYQADRLYQYIKKLDSLQISEAYYFKLVEGTDNPAHSKSGLIDNTSLTEKPAYEVFKTFTHCTTAISRKDIQQIRVYPNPMKHFTRIEFEDFNPQNEKTILMYGTNGQLIWQTKGVFQNYYVLKRENLSSGLYYVKIKDSTGIIAQGKLILK
jgi:hypothetical protein